MLFSLMHGIRSLGKESYIVTLMASSSHADKKVDELGPPHYELGPPCISYNCRMTYLSTQASNGKLRT